METCVQEQRVLYKHDLEYHKTSAFARQLLAATAADDIRGHAHTLTPKPFHAQPPTPKSQTRNPSPYTLNPKP
jgi:hypothetical protein